MITTDQCQCKGVQQGPRGLHSPGGAQVRPGKPSEQRETRLCPSETMFDFRQYKTAQNYMTQCMSENVSV